MIDFPGSLSAVFFTSGCNFSCGFCHNAVLMKKQQSSLSWERLGEVCNQFKNQWVDAVCITGGEPTLQPELLELIRFLKEHGLKIKLDSNGSRPEVLRECLPLIDLLAMDIKGGLSAYPEIAGFPNIGKIEESVKLIMQSGIDYEFRTTVITPCHNDKQMLEAGELIKGAKRYALQAFVPQDCLPDEAFKKLKRTTPERLKELKELMTPFADEIIVRGT